MSGVNGFPVANFQAQLDQLTSIGACEQSRNAVGKFLLHDNVYAALMVEKTSQKLTAAFVLQKYGDNDAYLLFGGQDQTALDKPLDEYDWLIMRGPERSGQKTDINANQKGAEVAVTKLRTPVLPLGPLHFAVADQLQILFDLLTTNAFPQGTGEQDYIGANVTVDMDRNSPMYQAVIDKIGFSVMDVDEFLYVKVDRKLALSTLASDVAPATDDQTPKNYQILPYQPDFFSGLVSYDGRQAGFRRATFLGLLMPSTFGFPLVQADSRCLVALSGHQHLGFVVFTGSHISCLYAENVTVARQLATAAMQEMKGAEVHYYTAARMGDRLFPTPVQQLQKSIRRFHTRHIPAHVKWDRIFAANCGCHIV